MVPQQSYRNASHESESAYVDYDDYGTLRPTPQRDRKPSRIVSDPSVGRIANALMLATGMLVVLPLSLLAGFQATEGWELDPVAEAAQRAADLAECRMESRYTDARAQLRVDDWATSQCMDRRGWSQSSE